MAKFNSMSFGQCRDKAYPQGDKDGGKLNWNDEHHRLSQIAKVWTWIQVITLSILAPTFYWAPGLLFDLDSQ